MRKTSKGDQEQAARSLRVKPKHEKPDTELHLAGELTHRECATVLAALRVFQAILDCQQTGQASGYVSQYVAQQHGAKVTLTTRDITKLEHFEDGTKPLTVQQIDSLCERINLQPINIAERLQRAAQHWRKAATGDSNDEEHERGFELAEVAVEAAQILAENPARYEPTNYFSGKTGKVVKRL